MSERIREMGVACCALLLVSMALWFTARTATPQKWRKLRPSGGPYSVFSIINIVIAILPILGVAMGCFSAVTAPLTEDAKKAATLTLYNIGLAGGGTPTLSSTNKILTPILDYNLYLIAGCSIFIVYALVLAVMLASLEHFWLRDQRDNLLDIPSKFIFPIVIVTVIMYFFIPAWVAIDGGPILMICIFFLLLTITVSSTCYWADAYGIPVNILLIIYVCLISYFGWNDNHKAHSVEASQTNRVSELPKLDDQFRLWFAARSREGQNLTRRFPVYVVAAQGGGIYAAYHTASLLGALQDSCPAFAKHLFAISGVSGGSVGAAVFTAVLDGSSSATSGADRLPPCADPHALPRREASGEFSVVRVTERILERDHLAPVIYGLLVPDFLQLFIPHLVVRNDRARQFELGLERAFEDFLSIEVEDKRIAKLTRNFLAQPFIDHWSPDRNNPALILNTTEVGTGRRRIISPFKFNSDDGSFLPVHDQLSSMPISTAAVLSARFPWVTPAGWYYERSDGNRYKNHLVDGGYYDNSGVATASDIIRSIQSIADLRDKIEIRLIVLSSPIDDVRESFGVGIAAPLKTLLRVRSGGDGRTIAQAERELVSAQNHVAIRRTNLFSFGYPLPLGWRLSNVSALLIEAQNGLGEQCSDAVTSERQKSLSSACLLATVRNDLLR